MFSKSILIVCAIVTVVLASAFTSQMVLSQNLPSTYDPGVSIHEALKTARTPLLVEFYSDTCGRCQQVAPMIHQMMPRFDRQLTLVMINVEDPQNAPVAELFGVDTLPSVYLFDFKRMKKHMLSSSELTSVKTLEQAVQQALLALQ